MTPNTIFADFAAGKKKFKITDFLYLVPTGTVNFSKVNGMPRPPRFNEPGYYRGIMAAFPDEDLDDEEPLFNLAARVHNAVAKAEGDRARIGSELARDRYERDLYGKRENILATVFLITVGC